MVRVLVHLLPLLSMIAVPDVGARLRFAAAETADARAAAAVLEEAYGRLGIEIEVDYLHGGTALIHANSGLYDGDVQRIDGIDRRFPNLVQVRIPINYLEAMAFTGHSEIGVRGWHSLGPYRVGIVEGMAFAEEGTQGLEVRRAGSYHQLVALLEQSRVDVAIMPRINGLLTIRHRNSAAESAELRQSGPVLETLLLYHYLNARQQDLVPGLEKVLNQMLLDGTMKRMRNQVYAEMLNIDPATLRAGPDGHPTAEAEAGSAHRVNATRADTAEVAGGAVRRLKFSTIAESFETETAVAVLREAYKLIGCEFEIHRFDGESGLTQANAGVFDGELMRIDGLSRQYVNLVQIPIPLNYEPIVAFTREADFAVMGWYSLQPYSIGIVEGVMVTERGTRGMNRRSATSFGELIQWLGKGDIDVAIMPRESGLLVARAHPDFGVRQLSGVLETVFLYHYLHRQNAELVADLERELKNMLLDGRMRGILEQSHAQLMNTGS